MKLLFKLSITILILVLFLGAAYLALSPLLVQFARYQLMQQGFTDIEIRIGTIGSKSSTIEYARMSNQGFKITLQDIQAKYELTELLSDGLDTLTIESVSLYQAPDEADHTNLSLPSPEILADWLNLAALDKMPVRALKVNKLSLYAADRKLSLGASAEFLWLEQSVRGRARLVDRFDAVHQIKLDISPETGVDLLVESADQPPLSIRLKPLSSANGLSGSIKLDLAQIGELMGRADLLSGWLQVELSYFSEPGSDKTHFSVSMEGKQLGLGEVLAQEIQANLVGHIEQQGKAYRLIFLQPSHITAHFIEQGRITLDKLVFEFPQSIRFVDGELRLPPAPEQQAQIKLDNLTLDELYLARVHASHITLAMYGADNSPESCKFAMKLTVSRVEMGDSWITPGPIELAGVCPERKEFKWRVSVETESLNYQDTDYRLSMVDCELHFGNSEQGKLLDENPAELGGTLACDSGLPGGKVHSRFRLNAQSSTGHARFSITDVQADDEHPLISSIVKNWTQAFEFVSGVVSLQGSYRWWKNSKGIDRDHLELDLDLRDAGGHYESILFSGLNYRDTFELLPELKTSGFSPLSIDLIDVGIPIDQTSAKIGFRPSNSGVLPRLEMIDLKQSLLGGQLGSDRLDIDFNADRHDLLFSVNGLDLEQIIALQQLDGLSASGRLDGTIPVTINPGGVKITAGRIVAQETGGHIQYIPATDAEKTGGTVPGSELVLKILENLDYSSLDIDVDFDEDGELRMKLAIKGMSPQVDAIRPIHFNLTLEQNLITLLKSLRIVEGINDDIDKQVQKYFREQKKSVN